MASFIQEQMDKLKGGISASNLGNNSLWADIKQGGEDVADKVMGPSADYTSMIATPAQKGVGDSGDIGQLFTNGNAVFDYVKQLTTGPRLGNSQFVQTAGLCKVKSIETGKEETIPRWTLVNNRVSGTDVLPASLKNAIGGFEFDGLIPGMLGDVATLNPVTLLNGLTSDGVPSCRAYNCPVTDKFGTPRDNEVRFITPELELLSPEKNGCGWVGDAIEQGVLKQELEKKKAFEDAQKEAKADDLLGDLPFSGQGSSAQGAISGQIERATGASASSLAEEQRRRQEQKQACESCQEGFWVPAPFSYGPARMVAKPDYSQHLLLGLAVLALISFALIK